MKSEKEIEIQWEGLDARLKIKRDLTVAKIVECKFTTKVSEDEN
jgi:hypothetical protein